MEWENLGELQINQLALLHRTKGPIGLSRSVHDGRPGSKAANCKLVEGALAFGGICLRADLGLEGTATAELFLFFQVLRCLFPRIPTRLAIVAVLFSQRWSIGLVPLARSGGSSRYQIGAVLLHILPEAVHLYAI